MVNLLTVALDMENLSVTLEAQRILHSLNMKVLSGEKVTLTGPSGSGKSTLIRCLLGFVSPEAGVVSVYGERLTPDSVWKIRTRLAYVPQEPELGDGTVREVLERPFAFTANRALKGNLKKIPQLFGNLLLTEELLEEDVATLSGGEKQRIALIAALLLDRQILLLDEASSALDHDSKQAVIDLLSSRKELTVLSVSHDREWFAFSDRVVQLGELQRKAEV